MEVTGNMLDDQARLPVVRPLRKRRIRAFSSTGDRFACVRSRGTPHGDILGVSRTTSPPLKGPETVKMARPPHNSGLEF
jgi:hypothetical protein